LPVIEFDDLLFIPAAFIDIFFPVGDPEDHFFIRGGCPVPAGSRPDLPARGGIHKRGQERRAAQAREEAAGWILSVSIICRHGRSPPVSSLSRRMRRS